MCVEKCAPSHPGKIWKEGAIRFERQGARVSVYIEHGGQWVPIIRDWSALGSEVIEPAGIDCKIGEAHVPPLDRCTE